MDGEHDAVTHPTPADVMTEPPVHSRLNHWLAYAIVLFLLLDLSVVGVDLFRLAPRGSAVGGARPAAGPAAPSGGPDAADLGRWSPAISGLLARQARAILTHDAAGYAATLDPTPVSAVFRAQETAAFAHMAAVPFSSWSLRLVSVGAFPLAPARRAALTGGDPATEALGVQVDATYGLTGADAAPADATVHSSTAYSSTVYPTLVERAGTWYVAGTQDGAEDGKPTVPQLWDLGSVTVVQGAHALVLGLGSAASLRRYAEDADLAVPGVDRVWGTGWSEQAVVLVPATEPQMASLLGGVPPGYERVAAVATSEPTAPAATAPGATAGLIVVNPSVFDGLGVTSRRVVLVQELTHIATRAITTPQVPAWLSEGAADYTGHFDSGLPTASVDADLRTLLASAALPADLPSASDFAAAAADLPATEEMSWAACRMIAGRWGQEQLVALYRAVAAGPGSPAQAFDRALGQELNLTHAQFVRQWRAYLVQLVG